MMKAVKFKECNVVYAENQPEYLSLPCHKTEDGELTTCWWFSFKERLLVLLFGKVYLSILTFNEPLQPLKMNVSNPVIVE